MTQTPVPVTAVSRQGVVTVVPVACDAVNGNSVYPNNSLTWLEFTNSDGAASHTVTIGMAAQDGVASPGRPLVLAANATKRFGAFPTPVYGQTLTFTVDSALVKVAAYMLQQ